MRVYLEAGVSDMMTPGVTLHHTEGASDTGDIFVQHEVPVKWVFRRACKRRDLGG